MIGSNKFDACFRSFTYSKNSSDPSIEPCGTPHVIGLFIKPGIQERGTECGE